MAESIFAIGGPYIGVDESTRRALSQLNTDHPEVVRVDSACKKLGLKTALRVHKQNVYAHIGIPDKKVAILVRKCLEAAYHEAIYKKWKSHGWDLLAVTHRQTQMLTDEQLVEHLKVALKETGKIK